MCFQLRLTCSKFRRPDPKV
ncbi:hypothetical protein RSAG8_09889, partial [Rhizoctonia solani AG-8 WAC10335]